MSKHPPPGGFPERPGLPETPPETPWVTRAGVLKWFGWTTLGFILATVLMRIAA